MKTKIVMASLRGRRRAMQGRTPQGEALRARTLDRKSRELAVRYRTTAAKIAIITRIVDPGRGTDMHEDSCRISKSRSWSKMTLM